jgi:hypothetical protein
MLRGPWLCSSSRMLNRLISGKRPLCSIECGLSSGEEKRAGTTSTSSMSGMSASGDGDFARDRLLMKVF